MDFLQSVSIYSSRKPITTVILLRCTTVAAFLYEFKFLWSLKVIKKLYRSFYQIRYTMMFTHWIVVFCIFGIQKFITFNINLINKNISECLQSSSLDFSKPWAKFKLTKVDHTIRPSDHKPSVAWDRFRPD